MFQNYSSEQFQRIITLVSVVTSIPLASLNTTVATIVALIGCAMQLWGYIQRFRKGDVTVLGARK